MWNTHVRNLNYKCYSLTTEDGLDTLKVKQNWPPFCIFNLFPVIKSVVFWFKFQSSLFLRVQLTTISIGWHSGLADHCWQAISWNNVDQNTRHHMAWFGLLWQKQISNSTHPNWNLTHFSLTNYVPSFTHPKGKVTHPRWVNGHFGYNCWSQWVKPFFQQA